MHKASSHETDTRSSKIQQTAGKIEGKGAQALSDTELAAIILDHIIVSRKGYFSFQEEGLV
jgi:DNA repair protein RadC